MPNLQLYFLGTPLVEVDGQRVDVERRKALALLAYLALTPGAHRRDILPCCCGPAMPRPLAAATCAVRSRNLTGHWAAPAWRSNARPWRYPVTAVVGATSPTLGRYWTAAAVTVTRPARSACLSRTIGAGRGALPRRLSDRLHACRQRRV